MRFTARGLISAPAACDSCVNGFVATAWKGFFAEAENGFVARAENGFVAGVENGFVAGAEDGFVAGAENGFVAETLRGLSVACDFGDWTAASSMSPARMAALSTYRPKLAAISSSLAA